MTSLLSLFQPSSGQPRNKYDDEGRFSVPARAWRTRLPDTQKDSCMRLPSAVPQTRVATGHME